MNKFDVNTIPLEGSNLIEASAGTGKTYSISLLALRLMLEKNIPINKILMVTFTEAAVAELEERLRKTIRIAYEYCNQQGVVGVDSNTQYILDKALKSDSNNCMSILKDNLLLLDEIPIFTIHSFCHRTLNEFSFETKQLFEKELLTDTTGVIEEAINHHWRNHITVLDKDLLEIANQNKFNRDNLKKVIDKIIKGFELEGDFFNDVSSCSEPYKDLKQTIETTELNFRKSVVNHWDEIITFCSQNSLAKQHLSQHLETVDHFIKIYSEKYFKSQPAYLKKFPSEIVEKIEELSIAITELNSFSIKVTHSLYKIACNNISKELEKQKLLKNFQTFDDLIFNVHKSLNSDDRQSLSNELQKKYSAVFIDEFQDTDIKQYQIFYNAFRSTEQKTIIFYIGDPKQSIYAFRQADIETYKQSREGSSCYSMDTNFRSTPNYIDALNHLFLSYPEENFFNDTEIKYQTVQSSDIGESKGFIEHPSIKNPASLSFINVNKKKESHQIITNRALTLLNEYKINGKNISPSDIGIIVRKKKDGLMIKRLLNKNNVPAIVVDDIKIFTTDEAKYLQYIIEAINTVNKQNINKALLTILTGINIEELLKLDENQLINIFNDLQNEYQQYGIYHALISFSKTFNVQLNLLNQQNGLGERSLSNYLQLVNIINQQSLKYNLSIEKLIQWLAKQRQVQDEQDDDFNQRIESDDDAVNIVTIHKSKGLSYNIVLTESTQLLNQNNPTTIEYLNEEDNHYAVSLATDNPKTYAWYQNQTEKENRRLIYVTLTRAVYKSEIILSLEKKYHNTAINKLLANLEAHVNIEIINSDVNNIPQSFLNHKPSGSIKPRTFNDSAYKPNPWTITSYSNLNAHQDSFSPSEINIDFDEYNKFVYKTLPRGAVFGNFIHALFERLDFQNPNNLADILKKQSVFFGKHLFDSEQLPHYKALIYNVLNANLNTESHSFKLSDLSNSNKLIEAEFHYSFDNMIEKKILEKFDKPVQFNEVYHKGFIHGFIDLCFKENNQYYILDWKSNYLGNHLEAYHQNALDDAMRINNYHLQYFIYSIALCKHLKLSINNFDYEKDYGGVFYCFIRGCRANLNDGIYFYKPKAESILPFL